jgi:hypothetical protein
MEFLLAVGIILGIVVVVSAFWGGGHLAYEAYQRRQARKRAASESARAAVRAAHPSSSKRAIPARPRSRNAVPTAVHSSDMVYTPISFTGPIYDTAPSSQPGPPGPACDPAPVSESYTSHDSGSSSFDSGGSDGGSSGGCD